MVSIEDFVRLVSDFVLCLAGYLILNAEACWLLGPAVTVVGLSGRQGQKVS